ncbi:MAG: polyprenyl synthetase family protein [Chloroflexota bacterium]
MVLTRTPQAEDACAASANRVREMLQTAPLTPTYRAALTAALEVPGRILSQTPDARWAQCVSSCCKAAGGSWEQSMPAAAAVEIFMTALEVLDDEEDGEDSWLRSSLGSARTLNVSTGLLLLAQHGCLRAELTQATAILLGWTLRACSGQDADLATVSTGDTDLIEALTVTELKSASLVAAACQLGALCAGAAPPVQTLYAQFGSHLGMAAQLANDLRGAASGATSPDITLRRPTVPLVYAAHRASTPGKQACAAGQMDAWIDVAPLALAWAVAETYRVRALDMIPGLTVEPSARDDLTQLVGAP